MAGPDRTLLVLADGSRLETSDHGDQYWITAPDGSRAPCTVTRACQLLLRAEALPAEVLPAPPAAPRAGDGPAGYSPWQVELLQRLGLSGDDLESGPRPRRKGGRR